LVIAKFYANQHRPRSLTANECSYFRRIQQILTSIDSSLNSLIKIIWVRPVTAKRSVVKCAKMNQNGGQLVQFPSLCGRAFHPIVLHPKANV